MTHDKRYALYDDSFKFIGCYPTAQKVIDAAKPGYVAFDSADTYYPVTVFKAPDVLRPVGLEGTHLTLDEWLTA